VAGEDILARARVFCSFSPPSLPPSVAACSYIRAFLIFTRNDDRWKHGLITRNAMLRVHSRNWLFPLRSANRAWKVTIIRGNFLPRRRIQQAYVRIIYDSLINRINLPFITSFPLGLSLFFPFNAPGIFSRSTVSLSVSRRSPLPFHYFYTRDGIFYRNFNEAIHASCNCNAVRLSDGQMEGAFTAVCPSILKYLKAATKRGGQESTDITHARSYAYVCMP